MGHDRPPCETNLIPKTDTSRASPYDLFSEEPNPKIGHSEAAGWGAPSFRVHKNLTFFRADPKGLNPIRTNQPLPPVLLLNRVESRAQVASARQKAVNAIPVVQAFRPAAGLCPAFGAARRTPAHEPAAG
jgi:hypothetical protein